MIGYSLIAGDEIVSSMFDPYIWSERGFSTLFKNGLLNKDYGPDLRLLLVMYYVEGKFDVNGPKLPKVGNYSKKDKNISVAITVKDGQFHNRNEFERREFIVDSTIKAVKLVREKPTIRKLNIKFDDLIADIVSVGNVYLIYDKLLSR
jgi:hypothetical protein